MPSKNRIQLEGSALLAALARTTDAIKWLTVGCNPFRGPDGRPITLTAEEAQHVVRCGVYVGNANKAQSRVYYIKERDPRPAYLWEPDYFYWADRAVLRYAADQTSTPTKVKNKKLADLWDKMLHRNPAPKTWRRKP